MTTLWALVLLVSLAWAGPALAACTGSSPNLTAPTWNDVGINAGNCLSVAVTGDVITVSPGTYSVTASTAISKAVTLNGGQPDSHGVAAVTLNQAFSSTDMIRISEQTTGPIKITGFTMARVTGAGTPAMIRVFEGPAGARPVMILNNHFKTTTTGDVLYFVTTKGVISGNFFEGANPVSNANCNGNASTLRMKLAANRASWEQPEVWGAQDTGGDRKVYYENNDIYLLDETIDSDDASRVVIRFNKFRYSGGGGGHGVESGVGARSNENYKNYDFWDTTNLCRDATTGNLTHQINQQIHHSWDGTGFLWGNAMSHINGAFGPKPSFEVHEEILTRSHSNCCFCWGNFAGVYPGSYPGPHQMGWGYIARAPGVPHDANVTDRLGVVQVSDHEPTYIFANTGWTVDLETGTFKIQDYSPNAAVDGCNTAGLLPVLSSVDFLQEGREYFSQTPGGENLSKGTPFTGATGTGFGTRANRPDNCTKGVAYWSKDQGGNWNTGVDAITGLVDTALQDGTLDYCDATNHWTNAWYTPAPYPNVLLGTPPSAPTGFVIVP